MPNIHIPFGIDEHKGEDTMYTFFHILAYFSISWPSLPALSQMFHHPSPRSFHKNLSLSLSFVIYLSMNLLIKEAFIDHFNYI